MKRHGEISGGLYANSDHLAKCIGDGVGPARPFANVFLRGIGSIPDRFSNESRGLNAERTSSEGRGRTRRAAKGGQRGTSRSKGWSFPRVAGANSNNQARRGKRHRTVVTRKEGRRKGERDGES